MHDALNTTAADAQIPRPGRIRRYFFTLFAIPLLLYFPPFFIVRMPSYPQLSSNPDDYPILGFGFEAAGQNSDVVIYGDSTANHGIDPKQMSAELGVKVLNLPSNLSVLLVDDDRPLKHYIQLDKPPKVIVFYLASWNLDYSHDNSQLSALYTGVEMLLRYGTWSEIISLLKSQPAITAQFPLMFYRANLTPGGILHRALLRRQAVQVLSTNGHVDSIGKSRFNGECSIPQALVERHNFDSVRQLIKKYRTPETQILVYLAPIPSCTNAQSLVNRVLADLPFSPPKILPASLYVDDEYFGHLYADGVSQSTLNLVEAIRPLLQDSKP